jgi:transcriptional regulator with XRE-family HTH domain
MKMATEIRTFGNYIRDLRERSNLTLKEVATEISVDPSLLAKIERSERQPTKEFIERVATFFKVDSKLLKMEFLSDLIAYKILDEDADIATLKVAESKVSYLKGTRK